MTQTLVGAFPPSFLGQFELGPRGREADDMGPLECPRRRPLSWQPWVQRRTAAWLTRMWEAGQPGAGQHPGPRPAFPAHSDLPGKREIFP